MIRLLDVYSGAGGCAVGYSRAGFAPYGIDNNPKPLRHYPFPHLCLDALDALARLLAGEGLTFSNGETLCLKDFAAIHASPPCQHASTIAKQNRALRPGKYNHLDMIQPTRERLIATGKPYVIENVVGAELNNPVILCGSWFGTDLRRHRLFESSVPMLGTPCSHGWQTPRFRSLDKRRGVSSVIPCYGGKKLASVVGVHGHINYAGERDLRQAAMGIDWMDDESLTQAIPPVYLEYIGKYLMQAVNMESERNG